jgi:hypothetical protein
MHAGASKDLVQVIRRQDHIEFKVFDGSGYIFVANFSLSTFKIIRIHMNHL